MLLLPSRVRRSPIGLDIGHCGVRAVQLVRSRSSFVLTAAARCEVGIDAPTPGAESEATSEQVRRCLSHDRFHGRRTIICPAQPQVQFHNLELPEAVLRQRGADVDKIVRFEVDRITAGRSGELETRYWPLPSTTVRGPNAIGVAVPRGEVERVLGICRRGGLDCHGVEPSATALCRLGCLLHQWDEQAVWGILDVGCRETRLILVVDGVPALVRSVGVGGDIWTKRIAERLAITESTAEFQKRDHGITATNPVGPAQPSPVSNTPLATMILGALRTDLHGLAGEIKRSYEYVLSCYPQRTASDLILVGGAAATANLPQYLEDVLAIPVRRASSYLEGNSRLIVPSQPRAPFESFAAAIGLALEGTIQ